MAQPRKSLSELQAAMEEDSESDDLAPMELEAMLRPQSTEKKPVVPKKSIVKGKGKARVSETIYIGDSDDELNDSTELMVQHAIEESLKTSASTPHLHNVKSERASTSSSSSSKKRAMRFSDSDSSDLEILEPGSTSFSSFASSSRSRKSTTATPSISRNHKDKKPRVPCSPPPRRSTSDSPDAALKSLHSSVNSLLTSYTLKRITRPIYIRKKIELRDDAKEMGIDFDEVFGRKFDEIEEESASRGTPKVKDIKGKGKAIRAKYEDENEDIKPGMVDNRLTSAQLRAKQATGKESTKGYKPFAPRPNDEILRKKQKEWDEAKIVPLAVQGAAARPGGGNLLIGENKEAFKKAKQKAEWREADRKRKLRKSGGVDGWLAGAAAGTAGGGGGGAMPGAFASGSNRRRSGGGHDSDSPDSDDGGGGGNESSDYSSPDDDRWTIAAVMRRLGKNKSKGARAGAAAAMAMSQASQELAAFHRRTTNNQMRSTEAVDEAVKALGLESQNSVIPGMRTKLLDFQFIGLAFMCKREMDSKVSGGVLADEMGLGKTVQTIALMMARRSHDSEIRTNLIVVPLSLLSQWEDEIEKFAIGQSVHLYHGSNKYKAKTKEELMKFDIVITTHSTLSLEWPKQKKKKKKDDDDDGEEEVKEEKPPGILFQICWYRVVVDEAHVARNPSARISKAINKLDAVFRWALTGTPMINSLRDYFPLHRFLRNRPWSIYETYHGRITKLEKSNPVDAGRIADTAIGPLVLRRRKTDQLGGKALVTLPPRSEEVVEIEFDEVERKIYDEIEAGYQGEINKFFRKGTLLKNFSFILVLILRLKQLTVHPHLLAEKVGEYNREAELEKAKQLLGEAAVKRLQTQRLEVAIKRHQVDDLDEDGYQDDGCCPICDEPIIGLAGEGSVTPCGHLFCTDCLNDVLAHPTEHTDDLGTGAKKCKKNEAPCPLCRAPFSQKSLLDSECFEPAREELDAAVGALESDDDDSEQDVKRKSKDKKGKGKAKESTPRIVELSESDDDLPPPSSFFDKKPKIKSDVDVKPKMEVGSSKSLSRVKNEGKDVKPRVSSPSAKSTSSSSSKDKKPKKENKGDEELENLDMSPLIPSSKMIYILKKLKQYEAEDAQKVKAIASGEYVPKPDEPEPITRTIVLSQFTSGLDLLDRYLTENGVMSVRFQGSSSAEERREAIRMLNTRKDVRVMLLSTKAGGVGLNLTAACRVLSMDLAWSKAIERQAHDRAYRLGQERAVEIERIIIKDTIEERILNLQARKTLLSDMSLAEGQGDPDYTGAISVPDILSLFRLDAKGNREGSDAGAGTPAGRGGRGRGGARGGGFRGGGFRGRGGRGSP